MTDTEAIDDSALKNMTGTSYEDPNFKNALATANIATLRAALNDIGLVKTKRTLIERKLRKLEKSQVGD